MITLEEALRDQQDLATLLRHRLVPSPSVEKYGRNDGYGWASVLKEYSGYPASLPVEAVIPHGVYLDAERIAEEELEAPVPAVLNYPAFRSSVWEQTSDKTVIPSASPFLYALSLFRRRFPQHGDPTGTIFFPAHGTETSHMEVDWAALVGDLKALDATRKPVTVCIHMAEYERDRHRIFLDAGFDVVSAGNPWDPEFIYRWLHLLSLHRFAAGNNIGGCAYYSVKAGKPFFLVGEIPKARLDPTLHYMQQQVGLFYRATSKQMRETAAQIRKVFAEDEDAGPTKVELVDYLLGAENFRSESELRHVLEQAAELAERPV